MNIKLLILSLFVFSFGAFAQGIIDFEDMQSGQLRDSKGWHATDINPGAQIVNLNDNTYNNVLKFNASKNKLFTAFYSFKPAGSDKLVIDFDFKTNSYKHQTRIAVGIRNTSLKLLPYKSTVWLGLGYKNKLYYFSQGWKSLDVFSLNKWHHMKIIIHISGSKAGTFDVNVDGGNFEGLGLKWRNKLDVSDESPLGTLFFQINKNAKFKGREYLMIDNVRVKAIKVDKEAAKPVANKIARVYNGSFYSEVLKQTKNFVVILPENYQTSNKKFPVLYLFHGRGRNERSLADNSKARAVFMKAKFITVFPDGDDGWYINSPVRKKDRYNDYIEELMTYVESKLRISKNPAQRGLSGWSMGGYGCTMFAEAHSEKFSALAPIIALLDYPRTGLPKGQSYKRLPNRFGNDEKIWNKYNPIKNVAKLKNMNVLMITGQKCFSRTMNQNFARELKKLNISYKLKILQGGHSLSTVLKAIPLVVNFMNKELN